MTVMLFIRMCQGNDLCILGFTTYSILKYLDGSDLYIKKLLIYYIILYGYFHVSDLKSNHICFSCSLGAAPVLVATDVASRGLDIKEIT